MFDLTGRVALVTGAGQGVGAAIAAALAGRGAAVAVNDLVAQRCDAVVSALQDDGAKACAAVADVTDPAAVRAMVAEVAGRLGPVSILVNNAGIPAGGIRPARFVDTAPAEWDRLIALNVYGVLHCTQAVLPTMIENGWGRVVTITSESGRVGERNLAVYAASKAAAAGFMRSVATEVASSGVTCNCISLGTVPPPGAALDADPLARLVRNYPVGRLGTPGDVAAAAVWLASPEASWVSGQTVPVNGGYRTS
jgi:3-oxoacyl-[acyl-carrier protein] reductase